MVICILQQVSKTVKMNKNYNNNKFTYFYITHSLTVEFMDYKHIYFGGTCVDFTTRSNFDKFHIDGNGN